jgi:hypothetical protein
MKPVYQHDHAVPTMLSDTESQLLREHLILLRNDLLTYYQGPDLLAASARVMVALSPGSDLATGSHDPPPVGRFRLNRHPDSPWFYRYETTPR